MKKFLSLLLAAMMMFSVLPMTAFADNMKTLDMAVMSETAAPAEENNDTVAAPAKANGKEHAAVSAEWPNFRGNNSNMAIVSTKLPRTAEEAVEKWSVSFGGKNDWDKTPSVQIIVDNSLVVMSKNKIYKLSLEDGEILAQNDMAEAISYGYAPATYAEGMIFAPLGNGTVQAFDAKTLESLWIYRDPLKGQALSPITYSDGYIYTGFYDYGKEAAYVCLSVADEDAENTAEEHEAVWRDVRKGGFYWAGSVVVGDYIVYGSDVGSAGNSKNGAIMSRNKLTGELIDAHDVIGNQRSTVSYADGKLYFTTGAGYIYSAELGKDGKLNNLKGQNYPEYGNSSTSTPVVYNGYAYFGTKKSVRPYLYKIIMIDANTLEYVASADMKGYPQCSVLLSNAYEKTTGKIYLYATYNSNPGGITAIEVDQEAKTMTANEIFTPSEPQYCIASLICDSMGTIYYRNDSRCVFAVKLADSVFINEVEELIAAIGTVTKDSGDAINAARKAYDALTPEQKNLVTKEAYDALVKAEKLFDMIQSSNKPGTLPGGKTDSSSSGVIKISATGASKGEQNPNTGAPAMSMVPAVLVLAAAALVLKKRG